MRVTAVTTWFPTATASSRGSFVVRDLQAIHEHHDIRMVHLVPPQDDDGSRRSVVDGIDTLRIPMNPKDPWSVLNASRHLRVALRDADLVHSMAFSALLPFRTGVDTGVPWVHTEHWSAITTPATLPAPVRPALPLLLKLLRRPTLVTAVCEYLAAPIRSVRGQGPVEVVPCIVDPHPLTPRRSREDNSLRMVSTGGLIPRKDPLLAVDTVAELVSRDVDAHLSWIGEGPLRDEVTSRIRDLSLQSRVSLLGSRSADGVREGLGEADLFFGPTRADNFFVSAAEAIVAGRPVVLGATGGQGEYLDSSVGALVASQTASAYADAVQDVDARTRALSSAQIASTIGTSFSATEVGRAYARVYEQALNL
ncbi:MAG: glycosyl transferase family 1 [Pseudoxanthomonas suwonensis]|nr:MAG: glycosyl transferase family 1 [Pseudoxanthomonas suwonensis]